MTLLQELTTLLNENNIPAETGVFSGKAPDTYAVLTPLTDRFTLFSDNKPGTEIQEVRISLFTKGNYKDYKETITQVLIDADINIDDRRYIGHEDDTGYHHYAIDVAKFYYSED